jgi:uncharacterized protein YndB with AHSA1/START domain
MSRPDPPTARHEVELDHDPAVVWELLVGDGPARWLGEGSRIDAVPGGEVDVHDADTGRRRRGRVDRVEAPSHLRWTWWDDDDPGAASRVDVHLLPRPGGTTLVVHEQPTPLGARASVGRRRDAWRWRVAGLEFALGAAAVPA